MMNLYFKWPILWDFIINLIICLSCYYFVSENCLTLPEADFSLDITSDLANISLTISGFILTLLTLLITFRSSSSIKNKEEFKNEKSPLNFFIASELYFETAKHLKLCVIALILVALFGYGLKIGMPKEYWKYLFYYNITGLGFIILSLLRCTWILSKIIKMQRNVKYD